MTPSRSWLLALLLVGCGPCRSTADDTQVPDDTQDSDPGDTHPETDDTDPGYRDLDGDGYYEFYDCDDEDPDVHPGAEEICDDIDNDCDGQVDEDRVCATALELGPSDATAVFYGASADDQAGQHLASVGDLDGDGYGDLLLPSFAHDGNGEDAGAAYLFLGPVSAEQSMDAAWAWYLGEAEGDNAGRTVADAGDVNGDGVPDLLIGAPAADHSFMNAGTIYLVYGPQTEGEHQLADADARIFGEADGDWLGDAESLGDMNGDGYDDLVVASQYDNTLGEDAGVAYVIYGPVSGDQTLGEDVIQLSGVEEEDQAGSTAIGPGDVNADGIPDLIVGARLSDMGGRDSGALYLFMGPVEASAPLDSADEIIPGPEPDALLGAGWSIDGVGDHDGDGRQDFLVGARGASGGGGAWLVLATDLRDLDVLDEASASFSAESQGDLAGTAVCGLHDVNGDLRPDIAIGASGATGVGGADSAGAAYIFYGLALGSYDLGDADVIARGEATDDMAGWSIGDAGDVNGVGRTSLLMGALGNDAAAEDAGAIYLFTLEEEGR